MIVNHNKRYLRSQVRLPLYIWDESLRDGEQSPGVAFSKLDKLVLARALDDAGVDVIDAGFPIVSESERETIKAIVNLDLRARIGGTARAHLDDIQAAADCGLTDLYMFLPTSDLHLHHKMGIGRREARELACRMVERAAGLGLNVVLIAEDASRSDLKWVGSLFADVYEIGAQGAIFADTVGILTPLTTQAVISEIRHLIPDDLTLGIHCHDDFGLATANTLVAAEAGAQYITATVNGIGERAGNAALEEVVAALERLYGIQTHVRADRLYELSQLVQSASGMPVSPNKSIVGYNAFRHESGVHVQSMLKAAETYEVIPPSYVGRQREFVLGKHTGSALLKQILHEHDLELLPGELEVLRHQVQQAADRKRWPDIGEWLARYYERSLGVPQYKVLEFAMDLLEERSTRVDRNASRTGVAGAGRGNC